jgi:hypothetical protein
VLTKHDNALVAEVAERREQERHHQDGRHDPGADVPRATVEIGPPTDEQVESQDVDPGDGGAGGRAEQLRNIVQAWAGHDGREQREVRDDERGVHGGQGDHWELRTHEPGGAAP